MNAIEEKCKLKGVRLTDQRKIIAQVMSDSKEKYGAKDHHDVDELHKRVSEVDSKISIATVYRTCLLYTSPSPRDATLSRMPSSA